MSLFDSLVNQNPEEEVGFSPIVAIGRMERKTLSSKYHGYVERMMEKHNLMSKLTHKLSI